MLNTCPYGHSFEWACLKQADIQAFHNHINTINKNIQFTIEIPEVRNGELSIAFLDTEVITDSAGLVKVHLTPKFFLMKSEIL